MNLEVEQIEKLIKVLSENNLSEITIEDKDEKSENKQIITIKKSNNVVSRVAPLPVVKKAETKASETKKEEDLNLGKPVVSPMTGTFYAASAPQAEPFVKTGEVVAEGQVLCIVEAMKLMNEIEADVAGKITKICVNDGEMVESGQVLMYIR